MAFEFGKTIRVMDGFNYESGTDPDRKNSIRQKFKDLAYWLLSDIPAGEVRADALEKLLESRDIALRSPRYQDAPKDLHIDLEGETFSREAVTDLIEQINAATERGAKILVQPKSA